MKIFFGLLLCITFTMYSMRDPFNPLSDSNDYSSGLSIHGIIASGGMRACVVYTNGRVTTLEEGESFDNLEIVKINDHDVIVKKSGVLQTLAVK